MNKPNAETRQLPITNKLGLHVRAAARFVKCAEQFTAEIEVSREGQTVPATSLMGLLMLGGLCGTSIEVTATGADAEQALAAISELVTGGFGEDN